MSVVSGASGELDSLYQEIILDHYKNPLNKGLRDPFEAEVHHVNPTCGDEVTLRVHVEGGSVGDVSYDAVGCSISQASTSVLTDLVIGKSVDEAMAIHQAFLTLMQGKGQVEPDEEVLEDAVAFAGVARFPARVKCALLAWMAWQEQTKARKLVEQDGLSPEQRFFVGFAQWTCSNQTLEQQRLNAVTSEHSPPRYRINGVVSNMPQFARAFQCKVGQALVRPEKELCKVW